MDDSDPIRWTEPESARKRRASDRTLAHAGYRASAFGTVLAAALLVCLYAIGELAPFIIGALVAMLVVVGLGPALAGRFTSATRFELVEDQLRVRVGADVRYARFEDLEGYAVHESDEGTRLALRIDAPGGLFRDARRMQTGCRHLPLPLDDDVREAVLARIAANVPKMRIDVSDGDDDLPRRYLVSYAALLGLIIVSAPYSFGIVAPLWFDAIPFGLGWRPWWFGCWALMMFLGPGTFVALARYGPAALAEPSLRKHALSVNVLGIMFSSLWMLPATIVLLETSGLP